MSTNGSPSPVDDDARASALAAWNAGRWLNQLLFHMVQAWLAVDFNHANRAVSLFVSLVSVLRQAAVNEDAGDQLARILDEERENWIGTFGSLEHADALAAANRELADSMCLPQTRGNVREEVIGDLLAQVHGVRAVLRRAVENRTPNLQSQFIRFGEALDQGLYPPTVYRDMPYALSGGESAVGSEASDPSPPQRERTTAAGNLPEVWYLPSGSIEAATGRPTERWFTELIHCWSVTGLPGDLPRLESFGQDNDIPQIVEAIDRHVRTTLSRWGLRPHWDSESEELRVGGEVVRRIPGQSKNMILVIAAFEETGWPRRVDSPFRPGAQSLHETLRTLNEGLRLISFHADGAGKGVRWRWKEAEEQERDHTPNENPEQTLREPGDAR